MSERIYLLCPSGINGGPYTERFATTEAELIDLAKLFIYRFNLLHETRNFSVDFDQSIITFEGRKLHHTWNAEDEDQHFAYDFKVIDQLKTED